MESFKVVQVNGMICENQEAYDKQVSWLKWDGQSLHSRYEGKDKISECWLSSYEMNKIS